MNMYTKEEYQAFLTIVVKWAGDGQNGDVLTGIQSHLLNGMPNVMNTECMWRVLDSLPATPICSAIK